MKANWARTRNKYGDQATDIRVSSTLAPVPQLAEPFGPPMLTPADQTQYRPTTKPPTVPAPFYRRLAIEPSAPATTTTTTAIVTEVTPSPTVMKDSLLMSESDDDDEPNSEIERITNVNNGGGGNNDDNEDSRPTTPRFESKTKSPLSQLFASEPPPTEPATSAPSTNKSDSEEDEFIAMLKRK